MSRSCPMYGKAIYMDCLDCNNKLCEKEIKMKNKIVIGIDQSYKDTGISISYNGKLKCATHQYLGNLENNSMKRMTLELKLMDVIDKAIELGKKHDAEVVVIIEQIRLMSQGFINIDYIKSIGALNALIVDIVGKRSNDTIPVFSADTRSWKANVVGTSKPMDNKYGIDPHKWPTILWCISQGYKDYIIDYEVGKRKKGIIEKDGKRYTYNDNIADSICISLYGFSSNQSLSKEH